MNNDSTEVEPALQCYACSMILQEGDACRTNDAITYCSDCYNDRFFTCDNCGYEFTQSRYGDDGQCDECNPNTEDDERSFPSSLERLYATEDLRGYQSAIKGEIVTSPRKFSAEIECYFKSTDDVRAIAKRLPDAFGISEDGSLGVGGIEIQTPKLKGRIGEEALKGACKILQANNCSAEDSSCGLHIHLDNRGLKGGEAQKALMLFHLAFEGVMLSFLPKSRRNNRYCKPLSEDYSANRIVACNSAEAMESMWYSEYSRMTINMRKRQKYDDSRYYGINMHSLFRGHLEVRYHSGTINAEKILHWVALHTRIMDLAAGKKLGVHMSEPDVLSIKTDKFFRILGLQPATEQYLRARQAKFASNVPYNEQALEVNEQPVCVA